MALVSLAGCQVGPEYERPPIDLGPSFRYDLSPAGWQPASLQAVSNVAWWQPYGDPVLEQLIDRLNAGSPAIEQAQAQYRQALASLRLANANLYPTLSANAQLTRADVPMAGPSGAVIGAFGPNTEYNVGLGLSWEVDLWGALAKAEQRAGAQLQASAADLAGARLSAQTALASSYFQLRGLDQQIALLNRSVETYTQSLALTQNLVRAGLADPGDVAVASSQLEGARSQRIEAQRRRMLLENAVATLTGQTPSQVNIMTDFVWKAHLVKTPPGVPSGLLLRRPDIAAAEKRVAAANAQLGVATAAWFPSLTISANAGFQSTQFDQWFAAPAQFWALGPALAGALLDAGRRSARIEQAQADLDVQAASYRSVVLRGMQEVEDALVQIKMLGDQALSQALAVKAAREAVRMRRNQYEKGLVDFLGVAVLETTALNAERTLIGLQTEQMVASVQLVAALGGGWSVDELPDPGNAMRAP